MFSNYGIIVDFFNWVVMFFFVERNDFVFVVEVLVWIVVLCDIVCGIVFINFGYYVFGIVKIFDGIIR